MSEQGCVVSKESQDKRHEIGTLNEKPLHAALKAWYARPGDRLEVPVDGFIVDIVRDELLVEIQTGSFSAIKRKMNALTASHPVRLVYPVAQEKWIVKLARHGDRQLSRRKSPKRGTFGQIFSELVSFPCLLSHPHFSLEVMLIQEEELRRHDPKRAWRRRGWVTHERRLLDVVGRRVFESPGDLATLIPEALAGPWTTADLAHAMGCRRRLAQQMAYCLRETGVIEAVAKRGNAIVYTRAGLRGGRVD